MEKKNNITPPKLDLYSLDELTEILKAGGTVKPEQMSELSEDEVSKLTEAILMADQGLTNLADADTPSDADYYKEIEAKLKLQVDNLKPDAYKLANDMFDSYSADKSQQMADNEPVSRQLCGSLLYEGELTFMFGLKSSGKSTLGFMIGKSIAEGVNIDFGGGLVLKNEAKAQSVVYFDFELSAIQFNSYVGSGASSNMERVFMKRGSILSDKPQEMVDAIKNKADKHGAKVIFVDNVSKMSGLNLEDSKLAKAFMLPLLNLCKQEFYTIIIIGHTTKTKIKEGDTLEATSMRGSGTLTDLADNIIGLNRLPKVDGDNSQRAYIKHLNARHQMEYDENNIIETRVVKENGMYHECVNIGSEFQALSGDKSAPVLQLEATALIKYTGSSRKAEDVCGIKHSTLNYRENSLKKNHPSDYKQITGMTKEQLKDYLIKGGIEVRQ